MTENIKYVIAELKQKNDLDKLYKQNTIDFNDYFKYSGKIEEFSDEMKEYFKYEKLCNKIIVNFKKIEKYEKIIKKERAENYQKYTKPKRKWIQKKKQLKSVKI